MFEKVMQKTSKNTNNGAEKEVEIKKKPIKNTYKKKIEKQRVRPVNAGRARGARGTTNQQDPLRAACAPRAC